MTAALAASIGSTLVAIVALIVTRRNLLDQLDRAFDQALWGARASAYDEIAIWAVEMNRLLEDARAVPAVEDIPRRAAGGRRARPPSPTLGSQAASPPDEPVTSEPEEPLASEADDLPAGFGMRSLAGLGDLEVSPSGLKPELVRPSAELEARVDMFGTDPVRMSFRAAVDAMLVLAGVPRSNELRRFVLQPRFMRADRPVFLPSEMDEIEDLLSWADDRLGELRRALRVAIQRGQVRTLLPRERPTTEGRRVEVPGSQAAGAKRRRMWRGRR
jgi:hypothetical protein